MSVSETLLEGLVQEAKILKKKLRRKKLLSTADGCGPSCDCEPCNASYKDPRGKAQVPPNFFFTKSGGQYK